MNRCCGQWYAVSLAQRGWLPRWSDERYPVAFLPPGDWLAACLPQCQLWRHLHAGRLMQLILLSLWRGFCFPLVCNQNLRTRKGDLMFGRSYYLSTQDKPWVDFLCFFKGEPWIRQWRRKKNKRL
jgi:hypothetical protein